MVPAFSGLYPDNLFYNVFSLYLTVPFEAFLMLKTKLIAFRNTLLI